MTLPATGPDVTAVVRRLCDNIHQLTGRADERHVPVPSRAAIVQMMEDLRAVVFCGYFGTAELNSDLTYFHVGATLHRLVIELEEQISRALCFVADVPDRAAEACASKARETASQVVARLPEMQRALLTDVEAAYQGDPAARSRDETILCYPGILAMTHYRFAHALHELRVPLIPRMITELAHSLTGIDIHPGATIGDSCFIDHGTGVVIGETTEIGRNVRIYQGVTLGARSFQVDGKGALVKGVKRHPIVEDGVIIYSGATVLGPVTIGRGAVIGGNVWVTWSVAAGAFVTQGSLRRGEVAADGGVVFDGRGSESSG